MGKKIYEKDLRRVGKEMQKRKTQYLRVEELRIDDYSLKRNQNYSMFIQPISMQCTQKQYEAALKPPYKIEITFEEFLQIYNKSKLKK